MTPIQRCARLVGSAWTRRRRVGLAAGMVSLLAVFAVSQHIMSVRDMGQIVIHWATCQIDVEAEAAPAAPRTGLDAAMTQAVESGWYLSELLAVADEGLTCGSAQECQLLREAAMRLLEQQLDSIVEIRGRTRMFETPGETRSYCVRVWDPDPSRALRLGEAAGTVFRAAHQQRRLAGPLASIRKVKIHPPTRTRPQFRHKPLVTSLTFVIVPLVVALGDVVGHVPFHLDRGDLPVVRSDDLAVLEDQPVLVPLLASLLQLDDAPVLGDQAVCSGGWSERAGSVEEDGEERDGEESFHEAE